jgi:FKBP-type peptidyl-prolyl cis-trans isomerase FklB
MQKSINPAITLIVSGILASGSLLAQQSSTPAQSATPSTTTSKSTTSAAKKPATGAKTAAPLTLKTQKEKFSYAIGMKMGENMHRQEVPVDPAILARGLRDALAGGKTLLTDQEAQSAIMEVQKDMQGKQEAKKKEEGAANKKEGDAFLAANKGKDGVVTLPSGLQYKILKQGDGPKPTASDTVECNYRGTLISGKEFDSSYKRGQPASFPVGGVIKGWTEALQLMPVGSKWQLFVPADLAYGERGAGADIGPDATLIFEVELLSIQNKDKAAEPEKK